MPLRLMVDLARRVFITTDAVGGVWQHTLVLLQGLSDRQIETVLTFLGPRPTSAQCAAAKAAGASEILISDLPLDWTASTKAALASTCRQLACMAEDSGADLAHLHAPAFASAGAWKLPVVSVAHSCVTTWWQAVKSGPLPPDLQWRSDATSRGLRRSDAVIAPSASFAAALRAAYGGDLRIHVIYNGRSVPPAAEQQTRQHFVLSAGRVWDEGKNFRLLDECARRLDVPIVVAGAKTGPNGTAADFPHLRLPGPVGDSDLQMLYTQAAVFISPSRYEPFGLAVLEAALNATPLILSDIPTFRELWAGAAIFCGADDPGAFTTAIRHVLSSSSERTRLGRAAQIQARRFSPEAMTDRILDLYRSLPGQTAGRAA